MTEPRIQYARTSDGVNIAFATYGEGRPLVWSQRPIASHVQLEWQQPIYRAAYNRLATGGMLVRFDTRGVGLSDRDVDDFSLDARVRDLEAVADHLNLNSFALLGFEAGGATAIAYAARHPERVSHLVLVNCPVRGGDQLATPRGKALFGLADEDDWELVTENLAAAAFGYDREVPKGYGGFLRACITPEMFRRMNEANRDIDLSGLLAQIQLPTLIVHHSGIRWLTMDVTRELASGIPNARLLVIEGTYNDNVEQVFRGIAEFLGEGKEAAAAVEPLEPGAFRTVLFTDLVAHTEMMSRLGDEPGRAVLREHERITREVLKAHGGTEIKTMGDGFMASFGSVTKAVECAIALQRAFAEREGEPLQVRCGLNAGEPIEEDGDLFGATVILASRIAARAGAGEILIPEPVRHLLSGKPFEYADRGEFVPKGFDDAVRVYEVGWRDD